MRRVCFFSRLQNKIISSGITISCVFMIALLMGACTGANKKPAVSQANATGQASTKAELKNSETSDDQELVCRKKVYTGSRFARRVCATKAVWAAIDNSKSEDTDEFLRKVNTKSLPNVTQEDKNAASGKQTLSPF